MSIPIILLHGLGGYPSTFYLLQMYLQCMGYETVHNLYYPKVDHMNLEECVDYVDEMLMKLFDKENTEIILIGQSMGGLVSNNLHKKNWKIKKAIYIGSPLHGARLLNQLEAILPTIVRNLLYKKPYDTLKNKELEIEPPHPYHTISLGWFNTSFDGCVYKDEAILNDKNNTHLAWADHRTIFFNPRLWFAVSNILEE